MKTVKPLGWWNSALPRRMDVGVRSEDGGQTLNVYGRV